MKTYLKLRAWWRLRFGFCPLCNSSPPKTDCFVCAGDYNYGSVMPEDRRMQLAKFYREYLEKTP